MPQYTLESILRYRSDLRHCRQLLLAGSRSFHAASLLLPGYYRAAATALYAFCRIADDAIDESEHYQTALAELRDRLDAIYQGLPHNHPVDRALADVVERFEIPQALPAALLEGFEWDVAGRRYTSLSEVYAYAARVAGTVGAMMSMLMRAREPDLLARACDLGVAMQLTNIARDVGEDARAGRLYLPRQWMQQEGIDPEAWLAQPDFSPGVERVVARLLAAADELYQRSISGIDRLPSGCRPGIHAARMLYREIGRQQVQRRIDPVSSRSVVGAGRSVVLLVGAFAQAWQSNQLDKTPPLEETRFLVDAAAA